MDKANSDDLMIECDSKHLTLVDRNEGIWRDSKRDNAQVRLARPPDGTDQACSDRFLGFSYQTMASFVIVLCPTMAETSTGFKSSTQKPYRMTLLRTALQMDRLTQLPGQFQADHFGAFFSMRILHELMHAGDCIQRESLKSIVASR